ncbi:MAG TPA: zinc-binding dehydrogenase [Longimicrobiales bacterium]|nr:zinc-binding dehydrogenase [Longimicrobiales bacterium]
MAGVRAVVLPAPNAPTEVRELPEPALEPGSALLRVELSEVCGTDVHLRAGRLAGVPYPLVPGHVTVGRLEKVRGPLLDVAGRALEEGDRVTFLDVHRTCNACWYCLVAKASTRCPERRVYGITYGVADGPSGGWAEKVYLKPGTRCIRVEGLDAEAFMAGGCGLPTALHAVERGAVALGDTVLVLGSGPVGLSAVILARMSGALRVLCLGAPPGRLAAARGAGAHATLDIGQASPEERLEWVRGQTDGRGADVVIEAAGAPEAVVQAMRFARDAGRVVVVGQYSDHGEVGFNPHADLNRKHLDVRGCWGSDFSHFWRTVRILSDPERARPWGGLQLARYGLERADEALADVASGRVVKALIDPLS